MRFRVVTLSVLVCVMALGPLASAAPAGCNSGQCARLAGLWRGEIQVNANLRLEVFFHIVVRAGDTLVATMSVPAQSVRDIPVDVVSCADGKLRLEVHAVGAVFEGRFHEHRTPSERASISGELTQGPQAFPLELTPAAEPPAALSRPQEPQPPFPYDEEEVTYANGDAGVTLHGTLTLPRSVDPVPAVVLISGGGVQDRDSTTLGHKPYLVLADHLTRRGVAVLRSDDRGLERIREPRDVGEFLQATSEDFASDALAAVRLLAARPRIDARRIGLIGSSEGGLVAAIAATGSDDVAFVVLLATPGQSVEDLLLDQCEFILGPRGAPDAFVDRAKHYHRRLFDILRQDTDRATAESRVRELDEKMLSGLEDEEREWFATLGQTMAGNPMVRFSPWFRTLIALDPAEVLAQVDRPVLAISGANDVQVPTRRNLPLIEAALEGGGNDDFVVMELPRLNHMLQTSGTGSPDEYAAIEETFSPVALEVIAAWILERVAES